MADEDEVRARIREVLKRMAPSPALADMYLVEYDSYGEPAAYVGLTDEEIYQDYVDYVEEVDTDPHILGTVIIEFNRFGDLDGIANDDDLSDQRKQQFRAAFEKEFTGIFEYAQSQELLEDITSAYWRRYHGTVKDI